jgi:hypothetical protein
MTGKEKTYTGRRRRTKKENIIRERQSRTKENNTSYELHLEKVQGITHT